MRGFLGAREYHRAAVVGLPAAGRPPQAASVVKLPDRKLIHLRLVQCDPGPREAAARLQVGMGTALPIQSQSKQELPGTRSRLRESRVQAQAARAIELTTPKADL